MPDRDKIELDIQDLGLNAPRLTFEAINAQIVDEAFHVFPGSCLTVCCLTLVNGFNVVGHSACASPENFNQIIGQRVARDNAVAEIWMLEGYRLKQTLFEKQQETSATG